MSNLRPRSSKKPKARRGRGEDSVYALPDGRFEAAGDVGVHPGSGRRRRVKRQRATAKEALAALKEAREKASGFVPAEKTTSLASWLRRWLAEVSRPSVRPKTFEGYRGVVEGYLAPHIGAIQLGKLTPAHVQTFFAERAAAGDPTRQLQIALVVLNQALDNARKLGLVERNVAADQDATKHKKKDAAFYDLDQARALLATARIAAEISATVTDSKRRVTAADVALLELAFDTGARWGEISGAQWADFDLVDVDAAFWALEHNLVQLSVKDAAVAAATGHGVLVAPDLLLTRTPKTKDGRRTIQLSRRCAQVLVEHRERRIAEDGAAGEVDGFVFVGTRGAPQRNSNFMRRVLEPLEKTAGLHRVSFHGLRHTTATVLLEAEVPVHVVSHRLGHADVGTTLRIYAHVLAAMARKGAKTAGDLFGPSRATTRANGANGGEQPRTPLKVIDDDKPPSEDVC